MLNKITDAVKKAGEIYKSAGSDLGIEEKGSEVNLVTKYDKKIQDFLFEELSKIIPGCSFLGEEGDGNKTLSSGYCFIIDPIDGTTNFIKGFQHSAISVGLAKDGELIMGAVLDPDLNNLFYAEKGKGAFLNGKPIHASNCNLEHSLVLFGTCPYEHELAKKTFKLTEEYFTVALRCAEEALLHLTFAMLRQEKQIYIMSLYCDRGTLPAQRLYFARLEDFAKQLSTAK